MATVKIFNKKVSWEGLNLSCALERYLNTNNIALELYDEDGEFYGCVTLDPRHTLPKSNNAVIYNDKEYAGILNALTKVDIVKVVGKIDVKLVMRDLVAVNTRQFKEVDEDVLVEFARSESNNLTEFLGQEEVKEETSGNIITAEMGKEDVKVKKNIDEDELDRILNDIF